MGLGPADCYRTPDFCFSILAWSYRGTRDSAMGAPVLLGRLVVACDRARVAFASDGRSAVLSPHGAARSIDADIGPLAGIGAASHTVSLGYADGVAASSRQRRKSELDPIDLEAAHPASK